MARRSESRVLRPFKGLTKIEKLFEKSTITVSDKPYSAGSIILPQAVFEECSYKLIVGFKLDELRSAVDDTGIPYVDTALVLVSRGRTLRTMHVQFVHHLRNDNLPDEIEFDVKGQLLLFKDKAGFISTFALVLSRTLPQEVLSPFLTGTWLGRSRFVVGLQLDPSAISPQKLTKEIRADRKLGEDTLSFIDISPDALEVDNLTDAVTIYLDEDALSLLQTEPYSPMAITVQTQLACDVVSQLLIKISGLAIAQYGANATASDLVVGTGARVFVDEVCKKMELPIRTILSEVKDNPSWVLARTQNAFGMRKSMLKSLKEY
jgi:hypothetical protein